MYNRPLQECANCGITRRVAYYGDAGPICTVCAENGLKTHEPAPEPESAKSVN